MPKLDKNAQAKLTGAATLNATLKVLEQHFNLSVEGDLYNTRDLYRVLIAAAVRQGYVESVCNDLEGAPDGNTVRGYLREGLPPDAIRELEQECNRALRTQLPDWLRAHPQEIAYDLHDEPYYGQSDEDDPDCWVCRGEARDGTTHFYRCATAYVLRHNVRVTLAVVFVHPDDDRLDILQRLMQRVRTLKITVKCSYLDKGFASIPIMRNLLETGTPAIIAVPIRGKGQGGTRGLCHGRRSYRTPYTFHSQDYGELTVELAVVRTYKNRHGQRKATWLVYALLNVDEPARRVRKLYRRRFGIETGYRLMERVRARTTSPNPALRFFLMGLALLLINVWIKLQWTFLQVPGRGPRRIARHLFRLDRLINFLNRTIEQVYGVVTVVEPLGP